MSPETGGTTLITVDVMYGRDFLAAVQVELPDRGDVWESIGAFDDLHGTDLWSIIRDGGRHDTAGVWLQLRDIGAERTGVSLVRDADDAASLVRMTRDTARTARFIEWMSVDMDEPCGFERDGLTGSVVTYTMASGRRIRIKYVFEEAADVDTSDDWGDWAVEIQEVEE